MNRSETMESISKDIGERNTGVEGAEEKSVVAVNVDTLRRLYRQSAPSPPPTNLLRRIAPLPVRLHAITVPHHARVGPKPSSSSKQDVDLRRQLLTSNFRRVASPWPGRYTSATRIAAVKRERDEEASSLSEEKDEAKKEKRRRLIRAAQEARRRPFTSSIVGAVVVKREEHHKASSPSAADKTGEAEVRRLRRRLRFDPEQRRHAPNPAIVSAGQLRAPVASGSRTVKASRTPPQNGDVFPPSSLVAPVHSQLDANPPLTPYLRRQGPAVDPALPHPVSPSFLSALALAQKYQQRRRQALLLYSYAHISATLQRDAVEHEKKQKTRAWLMQQQQVAALERMEEAGRGLDEKVRLMKSGRMGMGEFREWARGNEGMLGLRFAERV